MKWLLFKVLKFWGGLLPSNGHKIPDSLRINLNRLGACSAIGNILNKWGGVPFSYIIRNLGEILQRELSSSTFGYWPSRLRSSLGLLCRREMAAAVPAEHHTCTAPLGKQWAAAFGGQKRGPHVPPLFQGRKHALRCSLEDFSSMFPRPELGHRNPRQGPGPLSPR